MSITDLVPWRRGSSRVPVRREYPATVLDLRREMERLIEDFFAAPFALRPFPGLAEVEGEFLPRMDLKETDKEIVVSAELPGMDENDIEVSLSHNILSLSGRKRVERENEGKHYYRLERAFGSFRRDIPLPVEVDEDKVEATYKRGVLTITLPKAAIEARAGKKVKVKKA